ncbi:MAG: hypothetical protein KA052_01895 [Candidatus Pacebacteria bacterium]|nr:hypothetical protein [Candidatus Paceibacterota bacterium]
MKTDRKNLEGGWYAPLLWFVLILAGFWILWYYSGGPSRQSANEGPFMRPVQPLDDGQNYGSLTR